MGSTAPFDAAEVRSQDYPLLSARPFGAEPLSHKSATVVATTASTVYAPSNDESNMLERGSTTHATHPAVRVRPQVAVAVPASRGVTVEKFRIPTFGRLLTSPEVAQPDRARPTLAVERRVALVT